MPKRNWGLSKEQWEFLGILTTIDQPVSPDIINDISSFSMKSFWGLLNQDAGQPLIKMSDSGLIELAPYFPDKLKKELKQFYNPSDLSMLLNRLDKLGVIEQMKAEVVTDLMQQTGQEERLAKYEISAANRAQESGKFMVAINSLQNAIVRLLKCSGTYENQQLLISSVFDLSILFLVQGIYRDELLHFLTSIIKSAESLGDRRSLALAHLHLGLWQFYIGSKKDGFTRLSLGKKMVDKIGDEDIMARSLLFRANYYLIQGRYSKVLEVYDQSFQQAVLLRDIYSNYFTGILAGLSAAYLGQFHRAIGFLDSNWHLAKSRKIYGLAASIRGLLGQVLMFMGKKDEAFFNLEEVRIEAEKNSYGIALYIALGGLAYYHLNEGNHEKATEIIISNQLKQKQIGMKGLFVTPWSYETYFELEKSNKNTKIKSDFRQMIEEALKDINIHIRGVALRLKSKMEMRRGGDREAILNLLYKSEQYLLEPGDPLQLAKTRIELARLKLNQGDLDESRQLAYKARRGLSGFFEHLYPSDLRFLLDEEYVPRRQQAAIEKMMDLLLSSIESLVPRTDFEQLMKQLLITVNNFLQAERAALFWFEDPEGRNPSLRAACNLTKTTVAEEAFHSNMALVFKTFKEKRSLIVRNVSSGKQPKSSQITAIICLPLEVESKTRGVVYLDYSYTEYFPDFINESILERLSQHIGTCIERIFYYDGLQNETKNTTITSSVEFSSPKNTIHPVSKNQKMIQIYEQAQKLAKTDATLLLLGETGTGKEFMARWIHQQSARADKPFIIIDPTTISENLFESEMFGYEKGAFTGANRQKLGRVEVAHRGTLFIDEIGEIPLSIQVKLLRVLQEKTFIRVGGTRVLSSDFRLLVATRRDLEKEVAAGRFREDLYYRIKIMEFTLLPLRKRKEDIVPLALFFLKYYIGKYHRPQIKLSSENRTWLKNYRWPGNIRELSHTIEKAVLVSTGDYLDLQPSGNTDSDTELIFGDLCTLDDMQRRYIEYILKKTNNKISGPGGAADLLGMKRTTLEARIRKLGVVK